MVSKGVQSIKKGSKASKPTPKTVPQKVISKKKVIVDKEDSVSEFSEVSEASGGSENDEDDDDEDIEAGMERIMNLLGDAELDEIAQHQLGMLGNDEDESGSQSDDEEEVRSGSDDASERDAIEAENEHSDNENRMIENTLGQTVNEGQDEVDLEDASSVDEDAVPRQKLVINNKTALERIRATFQLDPSLPWTETLAVTYSDTIDVDVNDDLNRELSFYKQALHGAETARNLASKHNLAFTRPSDFYAEMVKSDSHMERIRQRLLDETADIKRGEEKKREREGKKFGKKVQLEKLKEREKTKKDMEERIRGLKRKRKDALDGDGFDVQLEDAISERPSKRHAGSKDGKPSISRTKRDAKFGFGGKVGRRAKQNTKGSTDSFGAGTGRQKGKGFKFGASGKKGFSKRPGKSQRMASRGK